MSLRNVPQPQVPAWSKRRAFNRRAPATGKCDQTELRQVPFFVENHATPVRIGRDRPLFAEYLQ